MNLCQVMENSQEYNICILVISIFVSDRYSQFKTYTKKKEVLWEYFAAA